MCGSSTAGSDVVYPTTRVGADNGLAYMCQCGACGNQPADSQKQGIHALGKISR